MTSPSVLRLALHAAGTRAAARAHRNLSRGFAALKLPDDATGERADGNPRTFDRVVAALPGIPDDAKTPSACISMFKRSGFPSVDAPSDPRLGGSIDHSIRGGFALHAPIKQRSA